MSKDSVDGRSDAGKRAAHPATVGDWTGWLPQENRATQLQRVRQGRWRTTHLRWPAGAPQKDRRVRERYPTLPNWLAEESGGVLVADAGLNIMSPEARTYTRDRLSVLGTIDGKAEPDRLWRNLLSSQPMAFSIAGHLHHNRAAGAALMTALTGLPVESLGRLDAGTDALAAYALNGIEAEWFPPRSEHTDDMSGCDIAACLELDDGRRVLVTIEVKYTDTFSAKPVEWDRYAQHLNALGLDAGKTEELVRAGCSQVLRQVMITNSVRHRGLVDGASPRGQVGEVIAVVLAREDDMTARQVVETLDQAVGAVVPVRFWSHRHVLDEAMKVEELSAWADGMATRYVKDQRD